MSDQTKQLEGMSEQKRRLLLHRLMQQQEASSVAPAVDAQAPARLVPMQVGSEGQPLFLFHPATGGVAIYMDLGKELPNRAIYAISKQSCISDESQPASLQKMAAHYVNLIRDVQPEGPYLLGGYCLGGAIAYEMAQQLVAQGEEIQTVFLFDTFVPRQTKRSHMEKLWGVYDAFAGRGRFDKGMTFDEFHDRFQQAERNDVLTFVYEQVCLHAQQPILSSAQELIDLYASFQETSDAYDEYQPRPSTIPVVLMRPTEVISVSALAGDELRGWGTYVEDIVVHEVEGNHYTLLAPPNVTGLAAHMRHILEEV
ncbi:MAG: thioesterase domain-containing protein [Tumebacillaceae bacterium]